MPTQKSINIQKISKETERIIMFHDAMERVFGTREEFGESLRIQPDHKVPWEFTLTCAIAPQCDMDKITIDKLIESIDKATNVMETIVEDYLKENISVNHL